VDLLAKTVVGETLVKKHADLDVTTLITVGCVGESTSDPGNCNYVMGDIFHANPTVITGSNNFTFFVQDLCGKGGLPSGPHNCVALSSDPNAPNRGYRDYVRHNIWRRRILMAATNDGQLHFFDAGVYDKVRRSATDSTEVEVFTDGT